MGLFKGYERKEDGAIRFYDIKSKKTRFWVVMIFLACSRCFGCCAAR